MIMQRPFLKALTLTLLLGTAITSTAISSTAHAQSAPRPTFGGGQPAGGGYSQQAPSNYAGGSGYNDAALGMNDGSAERSAQQSQGNYAPLPRNLGMPLGTTQDAWSTPQKSMSQGQVAPGVVRFTWSQDRSCRSAFASSWSP